MKQQFTRRAGRVGRLTMAAVMGAALVPAAAFAHYEYNNESKVVFGKDGNTSDGKTVGSVEKIAEATNADGSKTVTYRGYSNSDNGAHFLGYSVYTKVTYDADGVMTAVDMSSGNDTFAGTWGSKLIRAHTDTVIDGYLPTGVDFGAEMKSAGVYTVALTGGNSLGYSVKKVTLMSVSADGINKDSSDADMSYEVADKEANWDAANNTITIGDYQGVNLVRVRYSIGTENGLYFDTYFSIGEDGSVNGSTAGNDYVDNCVGETTWDENADVTGTMGATNRDRWAYATASMISQRTLQAYAASLDGGSDATDELDTVTGATLVSTPYVEAIMTAVDDGYVKTIADNVKVTIDGDNVEGQGSASIDVTANLLDKTTVAKNEDGTYTIKHFYNLSTRDGVAAPDDISIYALGGSTTSAQNHDIVKGKDGAAQALATYTPESLGLNPVEGKRGTTYSWGDFENEYIKFENKNDEGYYTITTKDKSITHLAVGYTIGHTSGCKMIYDFEQMIAAQEVNAGIASMDTSDKAAVAAQRTAYDALCSDVKGFVTNIDTLVESEEAIENKRISLAGATVEAAACTYNGSAQQPAVKVTINGKTLAQGTDYAVAYDNNTNAGNATVTVTGVGNYKDTATGSFNIAKATQNLTVKASAKKVKAKKLKKKAQAVSVLKVSGAQGSVTYGELKGTSAKLKINAKTGKITVKKGTKKGAYKAKVQIKAAGTANYNAVSKTVTVKVKVK